MQTAVGRGPPGGRVKACHWGGQLLLGFQHTPEGKALGGGARIRVWPVQVTLPILGVGLHWGAACCHSDFTNRV